MSRTPTIIPPTEDAPPPADESPKLFADGELYLVSEIAERVKCSADTVDRKMRKYKLKSVRFGARKYWGRDINRVLAAEERAD
jgi:hypothetical protein